MGAHNNVDLFDRIYLTIKIDKLVQLFSFLLRNIKTTKNWFDILLLRLSIRKHTNAVFYDGEIVKRFKGGEVKKPELMSYVTGGFEVKKVPSEL